MKLEDQDWKGKTIFLIGWYKLFHQESLLKYKGYIWKGKGGYTSYIQSIKVVGILLP